LLESEIVDFDLNQVTSSVIFIDPSDFYAR